MVLRRFMRSRPTRHSLMQGRLATTQTRIVTRFHSTATISPGLDLDFVFSILDQGSADGSSDISKDHKSSANMAYRQQDGRQSMLSRDFLDALDSLGNSQGNGRETRPNRHVAGSTDELDQFANDFFDPLACLKTLQSRPTQADFVLSADDASIKKPQDMNGSFDIDAELAELLEKAPSQLDVFVTADLQTPARPAIADPSRSWPSFQMTSMGEAPSASLSAVFRKVLPIELIEQFEKEAPANPEDLFLAEPIEAEDSIDTREQPTAQTQSEAPKAKADGDFNGHLLVLGSAEIKLLDYFQLVQLAVFMNVDCLLPRGRIEHDLLRSYNNVVDCLVPSELSEKLDISRLGLAGSLVGEDLRSAIHASLKFERKKKPSLEDSASGKPPANPSLAKPKAKMTEWTECDDNMLIQMVTLLHERRDSLNAAVSSWLTAFCAANPSSEAAHCTALRAKESPSSCKESSFWKEVAVQMEVQGKWSPNACRKRWITLKQSHSAMFGIF